MAVIFESPANGEPTQVQHHAENLATNLNLPLVPISDPGVNAFTFKLVVSSSGLQLEMAGPQAPGPIRVDFQSGAINYRVKNAVRKQAITRAVGCKPGFLPTVLDATAGLGKDAFLLAHLGCRVDMTERDPVVHALLADGMQRAGNYQENGVSAAISRMFLHQGDFRKVIEPGTRFDVVYLDPMFPQRRKSAQVKKDMFVLQRFLGSTQDESESGQVLNLALTIATRRVVVKRPAKAGYLAALAPSHSLEGSSSRYDVYMKS